MTLYQTLQEFFMPVIVAIVEVHSYIIYFLFAIVTFVLVVLVYRDLTNYNNTPEDSGVSPDMGPGGSSGMGPDASPDDDDGGSWKRKLALVGIAVGLTVVVLATAGKVGWGDYGACWNRPGEFFGAGLDYGMRFLGITVDTSTMRKYLLSILPEVWNAAVDPALIASKLEIARIPPEMVPEFNRKLLQLGLKTRVLFRPIYAAYPDGACQLTLRAALETTVADQIDVLILQYATGDCW